MGPFRFRLERVLDWYHGQCQLEELRLAACLAAVGEVKGAMARLQVERLDIESDLLSRSTIPARDFAALGFYRLRVREQEVELSIERERRERAVFEQSAQLQAADRRLRLVKKLRERRVAEYIHAEDREMEGLAAEAYLAKWCRELT